MPRAGGGAGDYLRLLGSCMAALLLPCATVQAGSVGAADRPNIVLLMADDLGWGDVGYNGHPYIKTPNLDDMARSGIRFDRFYSAAPVCSPTRGSCLTGRSPYRYGVYSANTGHLKKQEISLAEVLKEHGYATGHFGKWHLGTMTPDFSGKGRRRRPTENFMTPGMTGFDEWFSTEYAVPTWDPYTSMVRGKARDPRTLYWHNGMNITRVDDSVRGCDSRIIMDRAIPFIREQAASKAPFLAVIWFHAPHGPVIGGPEYIRMYPECSEEEQHYFATITALDEQIGRLRKELRDLGLAENTLLWFCSDNGPEGNPAKRGRYQGSAGPFRGRKRSLYEGGVRVPGLLEWPAKIKDARVVKMPCVTSDYFPTCLDILGLQLSGKDRPYDGVSLLGLIEGRMSERPKQIGFQYGSHASLTDNRYKLVHNRGAQKHRSDNSRLKTEEYELYDLLGDPSETRNIASEHPAIVTAMRTQLEVWQASCKDSVAGTDYR